MKEQVLEVVAAFLHDSGRFLLCRRPPQKARGGQWEFPGGKIEPGETGPQALARECREELGVEIAVEQAAAEVVYAYPDVTVRLTLYAARVAAGAPRRLEHSAFAWVTAEECAGYDLCPADRLLLDALGKETVKMPGPERSAPTEEA
ncbi:MAG: (deoxy)nucleoside triphosphate pyrophosphohydrolase [Oscillospiraceae bacterium]